MSISRQDRERNRDVVAVGLAQQTRAICCRRAVFALLASFSCVLALSGCSTAPGYNTAVGSGTGTVIGGLAGGLASRNPLIGLAAALGGGLIGGAIGNRMDEREQRNLALASEQAAAAPVPGPVPWSSVGPAGQVTASGWVVPTSGEYRHNGQVCRNLDQHVLKDGGSRDRAITLCRRVALGNGASWVVPRD